jgi:hypothetical protein
MWTDDGLIHGSEPCARLYLLMYFSIRDPVPAGHRIENLVDLEILSDRESRDLVELYWTYKRTLS